MGTTALCSKIRQAAQWMRNLSIAAGSAKREFPTQGSFARLQKLAPVTQLLLIPLTCAGRPSSVHARTP